MKYLDKVNLKKKAIKLLNYKSYETTLIYNDTYFGFQI